MYHTAGGELCVHYYQYESLLKINCRWHRTRLCGGEGRFVPNIILSEKEEWLE